MGRSNGALGTVKGKVSNVVFYQLNGQEIIRGLGIKKTFKSKKVLAQNNSLKLLMNFFGRIKPFIKAGFKNEAAGTIYNYHNLATAYNRVHAMDFQDDLPTIRYERIMLSQGSAPMPINPRVIAGAGKLNFSWDTDPALPWISNQDQIMMLAWFPELNEALFNVAGALRSTGADFLPLPAAYSPFQAEIYMAFVSQDRESVSNSIYLGHGRVL